MSTDRAVGPTRNHDVAGQHSGTVLTAFYQAHPSNSSRSLRTRLREQGQVSRENAAGKTKAIQVSNLSVPEVTGPHDTLSKYDPTLGQKPLWGLQIAQILSSKI